MAITFEETLQTVFGLVRENERLLAILKERDARIAELEKKEKK